MSATQPRWRIGKLTAPHSNDPCFTDEKAAIDHALTLSRDDDARVFAVWGPRDEVLAVYHEGVEYRPW